MLIKEETVELSMTRNRYNLMEWAGAFGDLGTLIPFMVAYITILKLNPSGMLLVFGISMIFSGLYYKTPVPVQPMKAIGAVAITKAGITAGMIWGAGFFSGIFWLLMGITGIIKYLAILAKKPIITGIIIGLGISFIREAIKLMIINPYLAVGGIILTLILLRKEKIPAIFILLCLGILYAFLNNPGLLTELAQVKFSFNLPQLSLNKINLTELLQGIMLLALPQIPLTVGNGILAITAENNSLFPDRLVSEKKISISTGIMNILAATLSGIPLCHGAGGMAGHVKFGARTGGSVVILGIILTILAVFLGSSVLVLFQLLPMAILGVILLFAGLELLRAIKTVQKDTMELSVVVGTAIISIYNVGLGFLAGLIIYYAFKLGQRLTKK